jgi:hypothetical protein
MTIAITAVSSQTTSVQLLAADSTRSSVAIENTDSGTLYVSVGTSPATTVAGGFSFSLALNQPATLTPPESYAALYGIWSSDGSGGASITAVTDPVTDSNGAFSTFSGLKTAIAAWLRPNSAVSADMTTNIPKYVGLAEVMIRRELHLRALDQTNTALSVDDGTATVPTGFQAVLSMRNSASPYERITGQSLDYIEALDPTATGNPIYYCRVGSLFRFWPLTDATVRLFYRKGLTPLSADDDTNWVLAQAPDLYLYASLLHADRRLIGPRLGEWKEGFQQALESMQRLERSLHTDIIRPLPNGAVV